PHHEVVEAYAAAVEPQRRGRFLERLAVRGAVVDRHRAEPDRALVLAREMELTRQQTRHGVLIDAERVPQAVDVAPGDPNPRGDLFPVVFTRVPAREQPVGAHLGAAEPD